MFLKLITAPTTEPVTLATAKNRLKVDGGEDNALISALIKTARQRAEGVTNRALITQTWRMYLDKALPIIKIPKPPIQSVESIKTISATGSIVDGGSASGQAVLSVKSTSGFVADDLVVIDRDGLREEEKIVLSVQAGGSLTLTENLSETHTADQEDRIEKYSLVSKERYDVERPVKSPGRIKLRTGYNWPTHKEFASFIVEFKAGYGDAETDIPEEFIEGILQLIGHLYVNREAEKMPKGILELFFAHKVFTL